MLENNEEKPLRFRATLLDGGLLHVADAEKLTWNDVKNFVTNNKNIYWLYLSGWYYPSLNADISVLDEREINIFNNGYFYKTTFDFLDIMYTTYKPTKEMFEYCCYICVILNNANSPKIFEDSKHEKFLKLERL